MEELLDDLFRTRETVTTVEIARVFRIHPLTVRRRIRESHLFPPGRQGNFRYRLTRKELEYFLAH